MLTFCGRGAVAQVGRLDSLLQLLPAIKADTNGVLLYINIGEHYRRMGDLKASAEYHLKARALSKELNYLHGLYYSSDYYSFILHGRGLFDSAITVNREMMDIALKHGDALQIANEQFNIGIGFAYKWFNETDLYYYIEALAYFEDASDREGTADVCNLLQGILARMNRFEEAIHFGEKALTFQNDTLSVTYGNTLLGLAVGYSSLSPPQNEKALAYLRSTLQIAAHTGNAVLEARAFNCMGNTYFQSNQVSDSETYYRKALNFFREETFPNEFCIANIGLAKVAMFRNRFAQAEAMALKNLELSRRYGIRLEEKNALSFLWELSVAKHDFLGRNRYKAAADSMQNVVVNETMLRAVEELNIKYETDKRELTISTLQEEKRLMVWFALTGGGVLLLGLSASLLLWRWSVQRRRLAEKQRMLSEQQRAFALQQRALAEQQVKQLEQEKQLVATQAILDGETAERTRISRDLHDGLGGLLSVVRLNLDEMKSSVSFGQELVERFGKTIGLLDSSIDEMRRVAHHLMPDSLSRFGLKTALTDFLNAVPAVEFHYFGHDQRIDRMLEVVVYRIVHELVTNALKHAGASRIAVQVIQESDRIALTVEDNGCGFVFAAMTQGVGLRNIQHRVESFGGILDVRSVVGEGTEVSVEIRVES
jgi:signal transduction histidine kinase